MSQSSRKPLGELVAEDDRQMLDQAFYESEDYKNILRVTDSPIIVGRRGTGKSAIAYRLGQRWDDEKRAHVIRVVPTETDMYGFRSALKPFSPTYTRLRTAVGIAMRYALLAEIGARLHSHYKVKKTEHYPALTTHVKSWHTSYGGVFGKLVRQIDGVTRSHTGSDRLLHELPSGLDVNGLEEAVRDALNVSGYNYVIILDDLDKGYEPDELHGGIIGGVVSGALHINSSIHSVNTLAFLRDNMFRVIFRYDPDFTRNIEGKYLRLHWTDYELFNMVCNRLRVAFNLTSENNRRVWERCTDRDLQGSNGFTSCLHHTLYRPRDLIALLNDAFWNAAKSNRSRIIGEDLGVAAKDISGTRLDDLVKEYMDVFPFLKRVIEAFRDRRARLSYGEIVQFIKVIMADEGLDAPTRRELNIMGTPEEVIRSLYGLGFLGILDRSANVYDFCHDGKLPERSLAEDDELLVHPCYQIALNLVEADLSREQASEIPPDYDLRVSEETTERRKHLLGQHLSALDAIPHGEAGAKDFEEWCLKSLRIALAGVLDALRLQPASGSRRRRIIVGSKHQGADVWDELQDDAETEGLAFFIKNHCNLQRAEYEEIAHEMATVGTALGFVVTRDERCEVRAGAELDWIRDTHRESGRHVLKINDRFLWNILSKMRNPDRLDAGKEQLGKLLKTYSRQYLARHNSSKKNRGKKRKARHARRKAHAGNEARVMRKELSEQDRQVCHEARSRVIRAASGPECPAMLGESDAVLDIWKKIEDSARTEYAVLIVGETGTGKELVARMIHRASKRRSGAFVPINCATLGGVSLEGELFGHKKGAFTGAIDDRQGAFRSADGGVLFLDEVSEMTVELQAKLLRVLQEGKVKPLGHDREEVVDVRVVAATNADIDARVESKEFRRDLLHRIDVHRFVMPPLRSRAEDIPLLVEHIMLCERGRLTSSDSIPIHARPEWLSALQREEWKGNVRELENRIKQAIANKDEAAFEWGAADDVVSVDRIRDALQKTDGNKKRAAEILGIARPTLYDKMKQLGMDA